MTQVSRLISLFLFFLPFSLVVGRGVSDLTISLISILFVIYLFFQKQLNIFKNNITIFFFIFFFYITIRGLFSIYPHESLFYNEGIIFYFRFYIFSYAFLYFVLFDNNSIKLITFYKIAVWISFLVCIDGYIQFIFGQNLLGFPKINEIRLSGIFYNQGIIGVFLSKMLFLIISIRVFLFKSYEFSINFVFFIFLNFILILLSGERGAFLLTFIFIFFYLLLFQRKKNLFIFLVLIIILTSIAIIFSEDVSQRAQQTINEFKVNNIKFLPITPHHEVHYISALKMFFSNIFFGQGTGLFRDLCSLESFAYSNNLFSSSCSTHPHNYFMQLLSENGLIGFFFITFFYIWMLKEFILSLYKNLNDYHYYKISLLVSLINFFPLIPHMSFYNNWLNIMIYMPLALIFFYNFKKHV